MKNIFHIFPLQSKYIFDIIPRKREMKKHTLILFTIASLVPGVSGAATTCSRANLTRCLDSACAINISSNPAARCQYCGTSSAGEPTSVGMRSISVGTSAKYNISDKDLKNAPTEPSERYAWAAKQCLKKVAGCSVDDIAETYDTLIEQSCKAAGIAAEMKTLAQEASEKRSSTSCTAELTACIIKDTHCGSDYSNCKQDADFNKFFAACGVDATGCDEHMSNIRDNLIAARDNAINNAESLLQAIVMAYENTRTNLLNSTKNQCADNSGRDACIERVCAANMTNKCGDGFEEERAMATQLCKFHEIACATLR